MRLTVNGRTHTLALESRTSLLDALRDGLGLTGAKQVCDRGAWAPAPSSGTWAAWKRSARPSMWKARSRSRV
ncbi:MAG: hypothetical protein AUH78_15040 [Gemmatimonadetes bacterium 13_1_40CM_4_69_8]|nr:MAG: hypothetical protein AUH78_15040 [Gemmatimonadetes bacterium 13_1_40CM_4_69_8]